MSSFADLVSLLSPGQVADLERVSARLLENPEELDNRDPHAAPGTVVEKKERPPHVR